MTSATHAASLERRASFTGEYNVTETSSQASFAAHCGPSLLLGGPTGRSSLSLPVLVVTRAHLTSWWHKSTVASPSRRAPGAPGAEVVSAFVGGSTRSLYPFPALESIACSRMIRSLGGTGQEHKKKTFFLHRFRLMPSFLSSKSAPRRCQKCNCNHFAAPLWGCSGVRSYGSQPWTSLSLVLPGWGL